MSEFNRELFQAEAELQQNQNQLNDVRDAMAAATREWDALQLERTSIIARLVELRHVDE